MRSTIITITICALILSIGCSEDDTAVTPNGNVSDTIQMVLIPAGTFQMGNITNHPNGSFDEMPVHEVTITHSFLMSRTEVTQAQYEVVMGNNPSKFKGDNHPVTRVNWFEAIKFCNALSVKEGLDTCYTSWVTPLKDSVSCDFDANGYRLPTEAEWEYACRAGTQTDFYTGNMNHSGCSPLDASLDKAGWYCGNDNGTVKPVGLKQANNFGLSDMHGNVYEWCWDRYQHDYYSTSPQVNPQGAPTGIIRVFRGGSWGSEWGDSNTDAANYCRSSYRSWLHQPTLGSKFIGLRLVRYE
jgi:formylglycine-generating enzyme required for sulfatase activity